MPDELERVPDELQQANGIIEPSKLPCSESTIDINDLPIEALHLIFGSLAPRELCRTSAVCKAWRDMNKDASANRVSDVYYCKLFTSKTLQSLEKQADA